MKHRDHERGFVLIGTVWLLLLCTAIVALILVSAREGDTAAARSGEQLQQGLDLDAAAQTIEAELLLGGPTSPWARLPARGTVQIGSHNLTVEVTSEAGRLDLNDADLKVIDDALLGLQCSSITRGQFASKLAQQRLAGRITSSAEVDGTVDLLALDRSAPCAADIWTIDSNLARPDPAQAGDVLRRALGTTSPDSAIPLAAGSALRMIVTTQGGARRIMVMRVNTVGALPVSVSRWWR